MARLGDTIFVGTGRDGATQPALVCACLRLERPAPRGRGALETRMLWPCAAAPCCCGGAARALPEDTLTYLANVFNRQAHAFTPNTA
jgi:hypothetical protein